MSAAYWTAARLATLRADIDEFERLAFTAQFRSLNERKSAMSTTAQACNDDNIRGLLGGSIDYLAKHPEWIRSKISLAREHVQLLMERHK